MSQQIYDSSGNPVAQASQTGSPEQQVANATGLVVNPATEDGNLASIKAKTDNIPAQGQAAMAASTPVVIASNQSAVAVSGPLTDTQLRATPVPVSGTITATTGGLTDTQLRASAVAVSAASLPLPAGAATSAKQPALGTSGTPSADVISIQGVSGMTALKVDGSAACQRHVLADHSAGLRDSHGQHRHQRLARPGCHSGQADHRPGHRPWHEHAGHGRRVGHHRGADLHHRPDQPPVSYDDRRSTR